MKKFHNFKQHLIQFTGLTDIAFSKGLKKNVDITIAPCRKIASVSGIETYSLRTQKASKHEFPNPINRNGNWSEYNEQPGREAETNELQ